MAELYTHLSAEQARSMAEITQSKLQLEGISSLWLSKMLPWVDVTSGVYQVNRTNSKLLEIASGHNYDNEVTIPKTAAQPGLSPTPRQYDLGVVQTILQIHTRAVDLYNQPHNPTEEQIRLTIKSLRERQEYEMINNSDFGLLNNVAPEQRIDLNDRPSADALDSLLCKRRNTQFLFAHPKTIAAFGHQWNKLGLISQNIPLGDHMVPSWRGVPLLSCSKIPVENGKSSIIAMRTGEDNEGVIGLRPNALPDQCEPGVNIRFMGINEQANISYLISSYFSVAVLVPDALGILDNIKIECMD